MHINPLREVSGTFLKSEKIFTSLKHIAPNLFTFLQVMGDMLHFYTLLLLFRFVFLCDVNYDHVICNVLVFTNAFISSF